MVCPIATKLSFSAYIPAITDSVRYHMYNKFKISTTSLCHCKQADMMTEHLLQDCQLLAGLRNGTWPENTELNEKLYGETGVPKNNRRISEEIWYISLSSDHERGSNTSPNKNILN
uniref:Uncharacterized protein n=1 Tax=Arion vulgaris TaxID=1028688 RepID=A0A0B7BKM8_9EUPU